MPGLGPTEDGVARWTEKEVFEIRPEDGKEPAFAGSSNNNRKDSEVWMSWVN